MVAFNFSVFGVKAATHARLSIKRGRVERPWRSALVAGLVAACTNVGAPPGPATSTATPGGPAYDAALERMLGQPDDPEATLAFVAAATEAGDLRSAISALERLVLLRPELSNIKLELGILYRRTGQDELAKIYLEQAMADPDIPPEMERRAKGELAIVSRPRTSSELTVSGFAGLQHDTNANAASEQVAAVGSVGQGVGDNETKEEDDVGITARLGLSHRYDLGNQRGDSWDSEASVFGTRYREVGSAEVALLDLETGPTFRLGQGGTPLELHPYVTASVLGVAGSLYRNRLGAGTRAETRLDDGIALDGSLSGSLDDYQDSSENEDAQERDGGRLNPDVGLRWALGETTELGFRLDGARAFAKEDWQAFYEFGGSVSLTQLLPNPIADVGRPASVELSVSLHRSIYDDPDPDVDPDLDRRDTLFEVGANLSLPVSEAWTASLDLGWNDNSSRVPNERYDNFSVLLGASFRFAVKP